MERDMELVIRVLEWAEGLDDDKDRPHSPFGDGNPDDRIEAYPDEYSAGEITYHIRLCVEAGFLKLGNPSDMGVLNVIGLTWAGHDMLDQHRPGESEEPRPRGLRLY